jgi:cell division protein FtsW
MERVVGFLDPWANASDKGYQSVQALLAFGSGGVNGVGLGLSRQKFFYLPEAYTDFILAIIGEEVGLIGTLGVVAAFAVLVWAGFKIATGARDPFGRLVAGGITGMIAFQAVLNMAAVTGLMPVTGKPLPFLSYGGSSMLVTMVGIGLLLSVSEYGMLVPRAVRPRSKTKETRRESTDERRRDSRPRLSGVDGGRTTRRRA